jgi:NADP-dependent 3-hydroxy acid dehydrogenase YdfG
MSFAEKVVWVTGASSGIGEALAHDMLDGGAMLVLSGRNAPNLSSARRPRQLRRQDKHGYEALVAVVWQHSPHD